MNRQKYEKSIIIHQSVEADPEELNFEDDPKAKDEIQYGRVSRNPTTLPSNGISYD